MSEESVILTRELIEACQTAKGGGYTSVTIKAFGVPKPLLKGWPISLIGKRIPAADYEKAMEGKDQFRSRRKTAALAAESKQIKLI